MKPSTFGKNLRSLRQEKGITQAELAQALQLGESTISFYESGKREPDHKTLKALANVFDVSLDYLMGRTDDPRPIERVKTERADYIAEVLRNQIIDVEDLVPVPILSSLYAGKSIYDERNMEGVYMTPKESVRSGEYFWLRITDSNMQDANIHEGDMVLVRQQDSLEDGVIGVVAIRKDRALIMKYYNKDRHCLLVPESPSSSPQLHPIEEVTVFGEVVMVLHDLRGRNA